MTHGEWDAVLSCAEASGDGVSWAEQGFQTSLTADVGGIHKQGKLQISRSFSSERGQYGVWNVRDEGALEGISSGIFNPR